MGRIAILILGMLLAGTGCSGLPLDRRTGSDDVVTLASALTDCLQLADDDAPARLIVWVPEDVTDAQLATIGANIAGFAGIESYEYIDRDATYEEFKQYFADHPDVLDLVSADQVPTSFDIQFAGADMARAAERDLAVFDGVDTDLDVPVGSCEAEKAALEVACADDSTATDSRELVVWLESGSDPADDALLEEEIRMFPEVEQVVYVDRDQTWAEFASYFADEPDLLSLVGPEQMPTSLRVTRVESVDGLSDLTALIEALPGVDEVETAERSNELPCGVFPDLSSS